MRILMLSDVFFPRVNGVSTSIATFRQALTALGHEVTLVAPAYPGTGAAMNRIPLHFLSPDADPGIIRVPSRYLVIDPEDRLMQWRALRRLLPRLLSDQYDVVHIQTPFTAHYAGIYFSRRLGIPAVATCHTLFEEYVDGYIPWFPPGLLRFLARRLMTRQCESVKGLVVPSASMAERLHSYGVSTHMRVIPTGVERTAFSHGDGDRFRREHGIGSEQSVLLYVGRLAPEKNIDFLIEMVDRLRRFAPDVILIIAGEGPARLRLGRLVQQLGLDRHVRFVGYLARGGALQDCYRAADVFVFASRTETQGLVLLEAMMLGVPVVSTAVMGTADVLCDGQGSLIAEEDASAFAAKVRRVLTEPELRTTLARTARQHAEGWSSPVMAERLVDYYGECITAGA